MDPTIQRAIREFSFSFHPRGTSPNRIYDRVLAGLRNQNLEERRKEANRFKDRRGPEKIIKKAAATYPVDVSVTPCAGSFSQEVFGSFNPKP